MFFIMNKFEIFYVNNIFWYNYKWKFIEMWFFGEIIYFKMVILVIFVLFLKFGYVCVLGRFYYWYYFLNCFFCDYKYIKEIEIRKSKWVLGIFLKESWLFYI